MREAISLGKKKKKKKKKQYRFISTIDESFHPIARYYFPLFDNDSRRRSWFFGFEYTPMRVYPLWKYLRALSKSTNGNAVALYLHGRDERNEVCFYQSALIKLKKKKNGRRGRNWWKKKIAN